MTSKSDLIRLVLDELGHDAAAGDVAAEVKRRFGVAVSGGMVRVVKSRDRGGTAPAPRPVPRRDVREMPRVVPSVAEYDDDDEYGAEPDRDHELEALRAGLRVPRPNRRPVRKPEPAGHADDGYMLALAGKVIRAVERAVSGDPQQITGPDSFIRNVAACLDDEDLRRDNEPYEYSIMAAPGGMMTLRLYSPEIEEFKAGQTRSAEADIPLFANRSQPRKRRKGEPGKCAWCGRSPGFSTTALYKVTGGSLGPNSLILCDRHANTEVRSGYATARAYELPEGILAPSGVIVQPKTPMQRLREITIAALSGVPPEYEQADG